MLGNTINRQTNIDTKFNINPTSKHIIIRLSDEAIIASRKSVVDESSRRQYKIWEHISKDGQLKTINPEDIGEFYGQFADLSAAEETLDKINNPDADSPRFAFKSYRKMPG